MLRIWQHLGADAVCPDKQDVVTLLWAAAAAAAAVLGLQRDASGLQIEGLHRMRQGSVYTAGSRMNHVLGVVSTPACNRKHAPTFDWNITQLSARKSKHLDRIGVELEADGRVQAMRLLDQAGAPREVPSRPSRCPAALTHVHVLNELLSTAFCHSGYTMINPPAGKYGEKAWPAGQCTSAVCREMLSRTWLLFLPQRVAAVSCRRLASA
jgi:hypothetical protein